MHSCSKTDIDPCTANTTGNQGGGDFVGSGVINKFLFFINYHNLRSWQYSATCLSSIAP